MTDATVKETMSFAATRKLSISGTAKHQTAGVC